MAGLQEIFKCGDLSKFEKIIKSRLSVPPHVGSSIFYLCEYENLKMLVKIYLYRKNAPEIYNYRSLGTLNEADSEIQIMSILRDEFLSTKVTPCIAHLFYHTTCENIDMHKKWPAHKHISDGIIDDLHEYQNLINAGLAENKMSYLVMELCNDGLNDIVENPLTPTSVTMMRNVLFQLIYTLAVITDKYPGFRHGDLHYGNVLLQITEEFDETSIKYVSFTYKNKTWEVPYMGFTIKIIDFGYSALPEKNIISSIHDDKLYNYYSPRGGDLTVFLYTVYQRNHSFLNLFKELDYTDDFLYGAESMHGDASPIPKYSELLDRDLFKKYLKSESETDTFVQKNVIAEYRCDAGGD